MPRGSFGLVDMQQVKGLNANGEGEFMNTNIDMEYKAVMFLRNIATFSIVLCLCVLLVYRCLSFTNTETNLSAPMVRASMDAGPESDKNDSGQILINRNYTRSEDLQSQSSANGNEIRHSLVIIDLQKDAQQTAKYGLDREIVVEGLIHTTKRSI